MPNVTVICFFSSLLCYGLGFLKISSLNNALLDNINYDFSILVSIATSYFVMAILFAVIGFLCYISNKKSNKKLLKLRAMNFRSNPRQEQEIA